MFVAYYYGQANNIGTARMTQVLLATVSGFFVGLLFSYLRLPIPAPPVLPGVMGIVGVYLGGIAYQEIISRFFS